MSKSKKSSPPASRDSEDASLSSKDADSAAAESAKPYRSKLHAVELALQDLGWDAMPARIRDWVREHFKLEMSPAHIGVNKTTVLRRHGILPAAGERASSSAKGTTATTRAPRAARSAASSSFTANEIRTVRGLLETYDKGCVMAIADVVGEVGTDKFRELIGLIE